MRICLVHDYLNQLGGAEKTLKVIHEIWPEAPIYTTLVDWEVVKKLGIPAELIRYPSWLHKPIISQFYKYFTLFLPLVFESFDLSEYDLVISTSANFAKGVVTREGQIHVNYCHTPPRFLYHLPAETNRRQHWFWGPVLMPVDHWLRMWDYAAAQRVDYFVANSNNVAGRIKKFYGRESEVIYPPVDIKLKMKSEKLKVEDEDYYLVVSRLCAYKNIDLIIRACSELNRRLKVVGTGPEGGRLKKLACKAGGPVELLGYVSDDGLADLYANCWAFVFATSDEDFGVVVVEAMSFGKPVIALRSGGVVETVVENETGLFFERPEVDGLVEALRRFESTEYFRSQDCAEKCRQRVEGYSEERFQEEFKTFLEGLVNF